ncbi:MAG: hypothetical protein WD512_18970 [Candidatus Paceibacterota bacterium]
MRRHQRGGVEPALKSMDNQLYPYEYGGSPSENSFLRIQNMHAQQTAMSKQFSGGKLRSRKRGRRGGSVTKITMPTFPDGNSSVSPFGANSTSLLANTNLINEINNSSNDCFATNTCSSGGGRKYKLTRTRRTRRTRRNRRPRRKTKSTKSKKRQY